MKMILHHVALICALLVSTSWAGMTPTEFARFIEPMCFNNDEKIGALLVNGQEKPLASTLENFISLAEKFEIENPNTDLKDEVFFFLRNFTYENIDFLPNGFIKKWIPGSTDYTDIEKLWEPDDMTRKKILTVQDPFSDSEKCSLFFMLSHSVIRSPKIVTKQRSYVNVSAGGIYGSDINLENLYPQETGVVAIRGTDAAVSLSRVLTGIYVGLNENRRRTLADFPRIDDQAEQFPTDESTTVDPLYILTLAEILMTAKWEYEERKNLAPNGEWKSMPIGNERDIKNICPMVYKLPSTNSSYTYSSVRGAADGLILGKIISPLLRTAREVKLSQVLRMYYSRGGVFSATEDSQAPIWASFCNREAILQPLEDSLKNQMLMFGFLATTIFVKLPEARNAAWTYYQNEKSSIYGLWDTTLKNYCEEQLSLDKIDSLPLETPLDVIVVLDSSEGPTNLEKQQLIVGFMAKEMDLRYYGSRMTILTDHRTSTGTTSGVIELEPVVHDTYSSACAACRAVQNTHTGSPAPRDEVILAIDQLLQSKKDNETKLSGVKGKIVIYFSYEEEELPSRGNKEAARLERALRDLHMRHQDVLFYAVGRNIELLKKYVRNDVAFVLSANGENEETDGNNLFKKVTAAPATLQYTDCTEVRNEAGADFESFVSPNGIQHWEMPAEYFYKSTRVKFFFDAYNGPLRVCHSRATLSPEREASNCKESTKGANRIEFVQKNPCKSFTKDTCASFYFSIVGINTTEENGKQREYCKNTQETQCRTLEQFKFKVTHDGVRCSGCLGLIATPFVLLLTALLSHILRSLF